MSVNKSVQSPIDEYEYEDYIYIEDVLLEILMEREDLFDYFEAKENLDEVDE